MGNKYYGNGMVVRLTIILFTAGLLSCACGPGAEPGPQSPADQKPAVPDLETLRSRLVLDTEADYQNGGRISRGTFAVPENRWAEGGRMIHLDVVILHALAESPLPDPVFPLAGGPGSDVTRSFRGYARSWVREQRDIVLVSQRGTGGDNRLDCDVNGNDDDLQTYLGPIFTVRIVMPCPR